MKPISVPKLVEFPLKELERDGDHEVLEILRERRRAICEFLLKIMNSFKIIDVRKLFMNIYEIHMYNSFILDILYGGYNGIY